MKFKKEIWAMVIVVIVTLLVNSWFNNPNKSIRKARLEGYLSACSAFKSRQQCIKDFKEQYLDNLFEDNYINGK